MTSKRQKIINQPPFIEMVQLRMWVCVCVCVCSLFGDYMIANLAKFKGTTSPVDDDQNGARIISSWTCLSVVVAPTLNWIGFADVTSDAFSFPVISIRPMFGHRFARNPVSLHAHTVYWHFYLICD